MSIIRERYSSAIRAKKLIVDERTQMSDVDVLMAVAFADRALTTGRRPMKTEPGQDVKYERVRPSPLAAPLARLFSGDNAAAHALVRAMAEMVCERAQGMKLDIAMLDARHMAQACLAWSRNPVCKPCGGHGKLRIPGTNVIGTRNCPQCFDRSLQESTGRIPFERSFRVEHREMARWLLCEVERETARVWPEAARSLAKEMDL
jgi:hypothetical protein